MKLILIAPKQNSDEREYWDSKFSSLVSGVEKYPYLSLALPIIAALTPKDILVEIVDEHIENINYDEDVDLVGITYNTPLAPRAYEIADKFRKRGTKVVLGGIHPSMLPEESIQHADSVVIGEVEKVWTQLINDFMKGQLKAYYKSNEKPDLAEQPLPRWDLVKNEKYLSHLIQTTRGCPYDCEFCSVKPMLGNKYRYKPVEHILKEIESMLKIQNKPIFFSDDNFSAHKEHTKTLLKELVHFQLSYSVQVSIDVIDDEELLELFVKSKCRRFLIGFETISVNNLKLMNKTKCNKIEQYSQNIEKIQAYGIEVVGSFIFGYDYDESTVFENTINFISNTNIAYPILNILTPFPGTRLFQRLKSENRLLHTDWSKYDGNHVCFMPQNMDIKTLQNGYIWAKQQVYSYESIFKRLRYLWNLWNQNNVRSWDRISPMLANLGGNDVAYSFPYAIHPDKLESNKNILPIDKNILNI